MFQAQNKSKQPLKLIIAPDPNQLEWIDAAMHFEGGIDGGGAGFNFGKQFRKKDDKVQKIDLLPENGESWKDFRMQTKAVYVTAVRYDNETSIGEENIKMCRGDRICFEQMVH